MNENVKVVFGLIGGLALFLYGMNSMSDALQKAAGERMKKILGFHTILIVFFCFFIQSTCRSTCNSCIAEQFSDDSYGYRFCQCGTYESSAGNFCYLWCQHRNHYDGTADGI